MLPRTISAGILRPSLLYTRPCATAILRRSVFGASRASRNLDPKRDKAPPQNPPENNKSEQKRVDTKSEMLQPQQVDLSQHPVFKKIPKWMHKYVLGFANWPVSHLTSFMILHEFTAIAPLFGIWYGFHYFEFVPASLPEWLTSGGVDFIKVMAERNGWDFNTAEGARYVVEGAAAYAIVKLLLPVRAGLSLMLMPWFARVVVIPFTRLFRVFVPKKKIREPKRTVDNQTQVWEQNLDDKVKTKNADNRSNDQSKPKL